MKSKQDRYIHKALNNRAGKWKSIALSNLAMEMTVDEITNLIPTVQDEVVRAAQERVDRLVQLLAPDVILDAARKSRDKAQQGKAEAVVILRRALVKKRKELG